MPRRCVKLNDFFHILITSVVSLLVLFFLTKLMGFKQMSQLSMFDYINGITIGSIAAEFATSLEDDYIAPLTAMAVYSLMSVAISFVTSKSLRLRRFLTGTAIVLVDGGKIYKSALKKARIDINDFLTECRNHGYFNVADISLAVMEANGKISILPKSDTRPVTPKDIGLSPQQEQPVSHVIIDGAVVENNLKYTGNDEQWLTKQLKSQGAPNAKGVFLATCDSENNLSVYKTDVGKSNKNIFE